MALKIIIFSLILFGFHIEALSTPQQWNDSIEHYYDKAMAAKEINDYKELFNNLSYYIKYQTDTTSYRLKQAYYQLGLLYDNGLYVKQNIDSTVFYLKKASSYGSSDASRFLFNIYYFEEYNRVNKEEAIKWLQISSQQGNGKSSYELGELYEYGKTFQLKDTTFTIGYSENGKVRYVRYGATQTQSIIIIPYLITNKHTAYEYYEKAVNGSYQINNQKVGLYEIAVAYMDGTFLTQDYNKAYLYLRQIIPSVSELSNNISEYSNPKVSDSLWRLSVLYRFGLGTLDNEHKANQFLRFAAQSGHPKAISALRNLEL